MKAVLGIDTSCYTTSAVLLGLNGSLLAASRRLLQVPQGKRGLAQSEMVFQHVRALPEQLETIWNRFPTGECSAVGATCCPRDIEGSYMPAFLCGYGSAKAVALSQKIPLFPLSHQANHLWAGIWSSKMPQEVHDFLAVHVSGGTTDLLQVKRCGAKLQIRQLGGSVDLHAGQLLDRLGVALGLPFPAGLHLEKMAAGFHQEAPEVPVAVQGLQLSLSGPETHLKKLRQKGIASPLLAAAAENLLGETLFRLLRRAVRQTGVRAILGVGGVLANKRIREHALDRLQTKLGCQIYLPEPCWSGDHALGAAYQAALALQEQEK
ncbi:hypothetical protein [Anaeroarcus burkinensis]|uniref:Kae1-like domain-containing protein n=1 Tax=Anaeroarcus burkinensis TaxID=82376 RepID=UPI0003FC6301|nr:hypothetical protein [Anaeroarcus burkinensis]